MFFMSTVEVFDTEENISAVYKGIVSGDSFKEVLEKLIPKNFLEDQVRKLSLEFITDSDFLFFPEEVIEKIKREN